MTPAHRSLALRLTSRNSAIPDIQALRSKLTGLETKDVLGSRSPSSRKRNAFGARNYQPHLKICGPNNGSPKDLRTIGGHLRRELVFLRFTGYEVCIRPPFALGCLRAYAWVQRLSKTAETGVSASR